MHHTAAVGPNLGIAVWSVTIKWSLIADKGSKSNILVVFRNILLTFNESIDFDSERFSEIVLEVTSLKCTKLKYF